MINRSRFAIWLLNLAGVVLFCVFLIWSMTSNDAMRMLFSRVSYYIIFLMVVLWIIQTAIFLRAINFSLIQLLSRFWPGILAAFVLTTLVFISVKVDFKTLSDETNLLSVSRSMATNKTIYNATMAKFYYDNLNPINNGIENRPLVFPFPAALISLCTFLRVCDTRTSLCLILL